MCDHITFIVNKHVYSVNYIKPFSSEFPYQRKLYCCMREMEYAYKLW
jgi:hypothetical protein